MEFAGFPEEAGGVCPDQGAKKKHRKTFSFNINIYPSISTKKLFLRPNKIDEEDSVAWTITKSEMRVFILSSKKLAVEHIQLVNSNLRVIKISVYFALSK